MCKTINTRSIQAEQTIKGIFCSLTLMAKCLQLYCSFFKTHFWDIRICKVGLGYVFDTDLADTIRILNDTHVLDIRFQNQEFWTSTTKWMFLVDLTSNNEVMGRTQMGRTDWQTDGRTRRRLYAPLKFFGEHNKWETKSNVLSWILWYWFDRKKTTVIKTPSF